MRRSLIFVLALSVSPLGVTGAAAASSYDQAFAALARKDYPAAMTLFRDAADHGDRAAQYNLGRLYSQGLGAPANPAGALLWFRKAAAQGHPGAQFELGQAYRNGQGVPRDLAAAAGWYRKAAAQGYAGAQSHLAAMFASGEGSPRDGAQAARLYRDAAEQGDADGAFNLGLIYAQAARGPRQTPRRLNFKDAMNTVFGEGAWRETSGFRTVAQEDQLRAQGAGTVPAGVLSAHSVGTPDHPGAYDVVVTGMSPLEAAAKFRRSGVPFRNLFPEDAEGPQGPHLHLELPPADPRSTLWRPSADAIGSVVPTSARNEDEARMWFRRAAAQGQTCAKLALAGAEAVVKTAPEKECAAILVN